MRRSINVFFSLYCLAVVRKLFLLSGIIANRKGDKFDIVIVKLDEIGDYIFFRNFIKIIYDKSGIDRPRILLIGSKSWSQWAKELDGAWLCDCISVDMSRKEDMGYFRGMIRMLSGITCNVLINASQTRKPVSDILSFLIGSPQKWAVVTSERPRNILIAFRQRVYNRLIRIPDTIVHEFDRHKFFFGSILNEKICLRKPVIEPDLTSFREPNPAGLGLYIVISLGATDAGRRWAAESFSQLIVQYSNRVKVVIVGGRSEEKVANEVVRALDKSDRVLDLVGKTSLSETLSVVRGAILVIGNESGVIHMADALNIPAVCILGGGHFGRFIPYQPDAASSVIPAFFTMDCYGCNWLCKFEKADDAPYRCIASVPVASVTGIADVFIEKNT